MQSIAISIDISGRLYNAGVQRNRSKHRSAVFNSEFTAGRMSFRRHAFLETPDYLCLMRILMVCLGNICRSPLAEGILRHKARSAGLDWHIESAGTNDFNMGIAPHKFSQKVALLNGIDICDKRARMFKPGDFKQFDRIYAMAKDVIDEMRYIAKGDFVEDKVELLLNELFPGQNLDVPDPWYGTEPGFHEVFKTINKACEKIVENYAAIREKDA